ncbi:MAG: FtsQ-type POTRA domain-containing protein [Oligoflexia bacterium]|nr:FtsQ-type POTRA domain-containing protein [Oligoflexia bacterium]
MSKLYRGNLNKKKKKKPGTRILLIAAVLITLFLLVRGCSYGIYRISNLGILKIKEINILVPPNISRQAILGLSGIRNGENILGVSIDDAMSRIKTHPWVRSANIKRLFPNKIEIAVDSKTAMALAKKSGKLMYIDEHGEIIDKFIPGYRNDLVIISSPDDDYIGGLKLLSEIENVKSDRLYINSKMISEIICEPDNIFTLLLAGHNFKLVVKPGNLEKDLIRIQKVIADLGYRGEKAQLIDATMADSRIVVKRY